MFLRLVLLIEAGQVTAVCAGQSRALHYAADKHG